MFKSQLPDSLHQVRCQRIKSKRALKRKEMRQRISEGLRKLASISFGCLVLVSVSGLGSGPGPGLNWGPFGIGFMLGRFGLFRLR